MATHVTADVMRCKAGKSLFSYMNLQVNNFVRWTRTTETFIFGGQCPRACLHFLAIYKFSNKPREAAISTISRTIEIEEEIQSEYNQVR